MKHYVKPALAVTHVVQLEAIAETAPWGSFANSLDELGGSITSYLFASGVEITVE